MKTSPEINLPKHKAGMVLAVTFALLVVGLIEPLMSWVLILNFCAVVVRASLFFGWYSTIPDTRTINLLSILTVLALGWLGVEQGLLLSMVNLLASACSLKLMVMRHQKDYLQLFLSLVFLAGTGFIFQQSMAFVSLYVVVLLLLLLSLSLQYSSNTSMRYQAKFLITFCLQAFPIAAVLFLVFPQLPPLWLMPTSNNASTGLSDSIKPGDIANLSQSSKLAFRAEFSSAPPQANQRYWRALVLENFDGQQWSISKQRARVEKQAFLREQPFAPATKGEKLTYRVYAEASRQHYLFTLDVPVPANASTNTKLWQTYLYTLISNQPLMSPVAYDVDSYPTTLLNQTDANFDRRLNLQLPNEGNEKTRQWVMALRQQHTSDESLIFAILNYFKTENFSYTLNPPLMQTNGIDKFMFEAQRGFCAHYASAMTFALRQAGIPARMVAGYHGGEMLNESVMSIYQYDAHAWVEVWLNELGWVRFDPTGVVAPERLTGGLQNALDGEEFFANQPLSLGKFQHIAVLAKLRKFLAETDYLWNRWVLGFDKKQQQDLFKQLIGHVTPQKLAYLMLGVLGVISLFLLVIFLPKLNRQAVDPFLKQYLRMNRLLETVNHLPRNNLAPNDYLISVTPHISNKAAEYAGQITQIFVAHQYCQATKTTETKQLIKMKRSYRKLKRQLSTDNNI